MPILIAKAFELGFLATISNYFKGFFVIFIPIVSLATALDSWYYGKLTIVPWNFVKVNVFDGLSQAFGSDPLGTYFLKEIPVRFNVLTPALIFAIAYHLKV